MVVLDHNAHLDRLQAQNKRSQHMYSRKYRKQTKKLDTTPILTKKKYEYLPQLVDCILSQRSSSSNRLKDKVILEEEHPKHCQATITNTEPTSSAELAASKRSLFN